MGSRLVSGTLKKATLFVVQLSFNLFARQVPQNQSSFKRRSKLMTPMVTFCASTQGLLKRPATEEIDQFDHQNDDDGQL
jgi:hypothetical protein